MPKTRKELRKDAVLQESADWMEKLRLDKKGLDKLQKTLGLRRDPKSPIPEPTKRLSVVLRYLVTGNGYDETLVDEFEVTFDDISKALLGIMDVSRM